MDNDYHALQREQNERIKSLETKVDDLEEDNKRLMGEENERLKGRIRKLEKWVAGAAAVIAAAVAGTLGPGKWSPCFCPNPSVLPTASARHLLEFGKLSAPPIAAPNDNVGRESREPASKPHEPRIAVYAGVAVPQNTTAPVPNFPGRSLRKPSLQKPVLPECQDEHRLPRVRSALWTLGCSINQRKSGIAPNPRN